MPTIPPNFSEVIRAARIKRGLSQKQVAEMIGASQNSLSRWENGTVAPRPEAYERFRAAFLEAEPETPAPPEAEPEKTPTEDAPAGVRMSLRQMLIKELAAANRDLGNVLDQDELQRLDTLQDALHVMAALRIVVASRTDRELLRAAQASRERHQMARDQAAERGKAART